MLQNEKKLAIIGGMEDSSFQAPVNQYNYSSTEMPKKPRKFIYVVIFLIVLVGFFIIKGLFFGSSKQKETPTPTPTPAEYQFPTDTPEISPTPAEEQAKTTVTPTTKTVNPVDSSTGLDRSTLSVEVQNGSGVTGDAAKGSDTLKSFGYKVSSIGNASNENYENVTIQVKSTKVNFLALLKKDLGFSYTVGSTSADLDSSSTADALVIIGK